MCRLDCRATGWQKLQHACVRVSLCVHTDVSYQPEHQAATAVGIIGMHVCMYQLVALKANIALHMPDNRCSCLMFVNAVCIPLAFFSAQAMLILCVYDAYICFYISRLHRSEHMRVGRIEYPGTYLGRWEK